MSKIPEDKPVVNLCINLNKKIKVIIFEIYKKKVYECETISIDLFIFFIKFFLIMTQ